MLSPFSCLLASSSPFSCLLASFSRFSVPWLFPASLHESPNSFPISWLLHGSLFVLLLTDSFHIAWQFSHLLASLCQIFCLRMGFFLPVFLFQASSWQIFCQLSSFVSVFLSFGSFLSIFLRPDIFFVSFSIPWLLPVKCPVIYLLSLSVFSVSTTFICLSFCL